MTRRQRALLGLFVAAGAYLGAPRAVAAEQACGEYGNCCVPNQWRCCSQVYCCMYDEGHMLHCQCQA